jgi:hypothetical protein
MTIITLNGKPNAKAQLLSRDPDACTSTWRLHQLSGTARHCSRKVSEKESRDGNKVMVMKHIWANVSADPEFNVSVPCLYPLERHRERPLPIRGWSSSTCSYAQTFLSHDDADELFR